MSTDIYETPKAELVEEVSERSRFYVVSLKKYLILNIATMGIYSIYWFYIHWWSYAASTGEKVWPIPRAIFSIFFAHALFKKINDTVKESGGNYNWSPGVVATLYVISEVAMQLADRLAGKEIGSPYTDIVSLLLFPVIIWALYKAQRAANIACGDETGAANSSITIWNAIWIFLGLGLWGLIFFGLYMLLPGAYPY